MKRLGDLLDAHASDCHLFNVEKFLCRQDHAGSGNADKHLGFESNVAVLHGMCRESVLHVNVKCAKIRCFVTYLKARCIFHQKGPKCLFWAPFSVLRFQTYVVIQRNILKHRENRGPRRRRAKASGPPCIHFWVFVNWLLCFWRDKR